MFWNKTPVAPAPVHRSALSPTGQMVVAVLERGAERTTTCDLIAAFDAASAQPDPARWADAAELIHIWLAVRCVCGDPEAVAFINDGSDRASTWVAA